MTDTAAAPALDKSLEKKLAAVSVCRKSGGVESSNLIDLIMKFIVMEIHCIFRSNIEKVFQSALQALILHNEEKNLT